MIFTICIFLCIIFLWRENSEFDLFVLLMGILVGIFMSIIISILASTIFPHELKLYEENTILSIRNESSIQGTFFLGSGSVDSETYYFYLNQREDGGINYSKIETSKAILYEVEDNFRIEYWRKEYTNPIIKTIFIIPILSADETRFYIPEGSILYNFTLNL